MSDSWDPWTVARQASFVCGISQARILEWVAILLHYIIKIQLKIKKKKKNKKKNASKKQWRSKAGDPHPEWGGGGEGFEQGENIYRGL